MHGPYKRNSVSKRGLWLDNSNPRFERRLRSDKPVEVGTLNRKLKRQLFKLKLKVELTSFSHNRLTDEWECNQNF